MTESVLYIYISERMYECENVETVCMQVKMLCSLPEALSPVRSNFDHMVHNMTNA